MYGEPCTTYICGLLIHGTEVIPALAWEDRYRYLGCPTGAYRTKGQDLNTISGDLIKNTTTIFKSPFAEWQKLGVFQRFLFPRLTFVILIIRDTFNFSQGNFGGLNPPPPPPSPPLSTALMLLLRARYFRALSP